MLQMANRPLTKPMMATARSARSDRALEHAPRLAIDHGGHLTVVHVVDEDLSAPLADVQKSAAEQAIQEHLKDPPRDVLAVNAW